MIDIDLRHEEPALERAVIYRGPQAPVLQAYVPLFQMTVPVVPL